MQKIRLSMQGGYCIEIFKGAKELHKFRKLCWVDNPCAEFYTNSLANGLTVKHRVWVRTGSRIVLTHELIHALTYVRNSTGMEDSALQEWLAYTLGYCLEQDKVGG